MKLSPTTVEARNDELAALITREFASDEPRRQRRASEPRESSFDQAAEINDDTELIDHNRNVALARIAGSLRRIGLDGDELVAALLAINQRRCKPPLGQQEVREIARSINKYPAAADTFPLTETGDAEFLASIYGERLRFIRRRGEWFVFTTHRWAPDAGDVHRLAKDAIRRRQAAAVALKDTDERKARVKWAISGESRRRIDNMIALARSEPTISDEGDGWNVDPWLLGVENGVLDLRTGDLRPGRPDDRITMSAGVPYDRDAKSELWNRTLREVFCGNDDLISFMQRALGYSLTGDTSFDCWFFCYGGGRNGKGTVLGAVRAAVADYAHELPGSALDLSQRDKVPADIAQLPGKRFVTSAETGNAIRLNHDRIKQLTGGDPVRARDFYEKFFEFRPACKLWLAGNDKPRVIDDSEGFWARVRLIPFEASFIGREDRSIRPTLERDPVHRQAVLAWLVDGCLAFQREGLHPPACVTQATQEYRNESDQLADFYASRCVIREGVECKASDLYNEYVLWANAVSTPHRFGSKNFFKKVGARFSKKEKGSGNWYQGVGVRDSKHEEPAQQPEEGMF